VRDLRSGAFLRLEIACYAQHLSNLLPVEAYRAFFPDTVAGVRGAGPRQPLINIRGGDILRDAPADYTLLPIEFYAETIRETGLEPVFMGQTEPNPYMDKLRRVFPTAAILPSQGPVRDFAMMRRSRNILVSVSTFSWLAAWLSHAERIILPLSGFYNPVQSPEMDFLPLDDPRYEFHLFPLNYAVPVERLEPVHRALAGLWRRISTPELDAIRRRAPEVPVNIRKYWDLFDEGYYLPRGQRRRGRRRHERALRQRPRTLQTPWHVGTPATAAFRPRLVWHDLPRRRRRGGAGQVREPSASLRGSRPRRR
jgi:hypothetical protein